MRLIHTDANIRQVLKRTRVREADGVCTGSLQNTSAEVLQHVKAAQCQVTRHHAASDRNGPVMSQPMNHGPQLCPSITAESKQAGCRCHWLLMCLHINTCFNCISASLSCDPLLLLLCFSTLWFLILDLGWLAVMK